MIPYSVSFDSDATVKIERAANWYSDQSPGLGDRFRDQVNLQIDSLRQHPWRHATRNRNLRCVPMKRFPFTIHYFVEEQQKAIVVYDFIDERRGPNHRPRQM